MSASGGGVYPGRLGGGETLTMTVGTIRADFDALRARNGDGYIERINNNNKITSIESHVTTEFTSSPTITTGESGTGEVTFCFLRLGMMKLTTILLS
jgi:hypothetical protein